MALSSWRKAIAATGRFAAAWAWAETEPAPLEPGPGEIIVEGQRVIQCTTGGAPTSSASVLTYRRVAIPAGTRQNDGAAVDVLGVNPKRVGYELYEKSGTAYLGSDDQVDLATGRPLLPTDKIERAGIGIYTGPLYAADNGEDDVDLSVWEWSNP